MSRQIVNAVDAGDGNVQVAALRRTIAANPGDLAARMELARLYRLQGFPELAVEHYRLASDRAPADSRPVLELAKLLRRMDLPAEGAASLEAFLRRQPGAPAEAHAWLGILKDDTGDFPGAEREHRAALRLAPGSDLYHNNLGYNLLLQGRRPEAADEFRRALAITPRLEVARNNLGLALAGEPKKAILQWETVTDAATAHNNLAAVLIEQGKYEDARRELQVALGYNREHAAAMANLRLVSELDGRPAEIPVRPALPLWKKVTRGIWKALGGDRKQPQAPGEAARTASRQ